MARMRRFGPISLLLWALATTELLWCVESDDQPPLFSEPTNENIDTPPAWNVYEVLEDEALNITQSLSFVKDIPVRTYWDVHRASFRTGVLGDEIIESFPQFVAYSLIKNGTKDSRGPISLINVTTIDTGSLLMHLFLVVKHMAEKAANTSLTGRSLRTQLSEFENKLKVWKRLTGEDWKTAAQLRTECSVKEIHIEMLGKRIEMSKLRSEKRLAEVREYYQVPLPLPLSPPPPHPLLLLLAAF